MHLQICQQLCEALLKRSFDLSCKYKLDNDSANMMLSWFTLNYRHLAC